MAHNQACIFVACCMSSQSDRNYFKTILIIVKFREVWKKKKERKTCSVQSDKTPRTNTRHCVVFCESAGKNPASQNSSFCKEWIFSDGNHMLSKVAAQPPSAYWRNLFSLAATKAALLRKHTVWPEQPPPQFIRPPLWHSTSQHWINRGKKRKEKAYCKKKKSNNKCHTHISSNMTVWDVIGNLVIWLHLFP